MCIRDSDTASAFICADEKNLSISAGTWALFGFLNDGPIVNDFGFLNNIANEGAYGAKTRIIKNIMGSWISQQAMKEFAAVGEDISYEHIAKLIRGQKENKYIIDVKDVYKRQVIDGCIQNAVLVDEGGSKYWSKSCNCTGLATAGDSVFSVKKIVFDDKLLTLEQLNSVLLQNFEGNEVLRQRIKRLPKYGNGVKEVDDLSLIHIYLDIVFREIGFV